MSQAVVMFNKARKDTQWGTEALTQMIELYLNPDQLGAWEQTDVDSKDGGGNSYIDEATAGHVAVAQALLEELKPITKDTLKYELLENQYFLATRQRSMIDKAMTSFQQMLDDDQDYLPAILGMASGFMIEKNEVSLLYSI